MKPSPTFLLIHGAGLGGWSWEYVREKLEALGAKVLAPTLTGLRLSDTRSEPVPSLETHIEDVINVIEKEKLEDVILVGHSYAGMVITGVADRKKGKIKRLVYLDAAVPNDGDDFASHIPDISDEAAAKRRLAFKSLSKDGYWIEPIAPELGGISKPKDIEWVKQNAVAHPLRTWLDSIKFKTNGHLGIRKTYILATNPPTTIMGYPAQGAIAKRGEEWTYREVPCGHVAMIIEPQIITELLMEAAYN